MSANETRVDRQTRRAISSLSSDDGARWAFRLAIVGAVVVYFVIGRHQWFTRDDWASIFTRETVLTTNGWQHWLFDPQDGHWLTVPILAFGGIRRVFGLDSYWPFLIPTLVAHVGAVFLVREICRRRQVSAWTTTMVCSLLLILGSGWENLIFAIQICYTLSLVTFLAQFLLVDHDGGVDRRDFIGSALAVVGMMSSGFGPIFLVGVVILLALRQRWKALLVAAVPQAVAYLWWLLSWSSDKAADARPDNRSQLPAFVVRGVSATFEGLTSLPGLSGIAIVATTAVAIRSGIDSRTRTTVLALFGTVLVMFSAIGFQRLGFGVQIAASSRYVHMAAVVIAPAFALMLDHLRRIGREARLAGLAVVAVAGGVNVSVLREQSVQWSVASRHEQATMALIAGSGLASTADPNRFPFVNSPDLIVGAIPFLIDEGAIVARVPVTDSEVQQVRSALGLPP